VQTLAFSLGRGASIGARGSSLGCLVVIVSGEILPTSFCHTSY